MLSYGTDGSREQCDIPDIGHSGDIHKYAFKAETESAVGNAAELSQIKIIAVVIKLHAPFFHSFHKYG